MLRCYKDGLGFLQIDLWYTTAGKSSVGPMTLPDARTRELRRIVSKNRIAFVSDHKFPSRVIRSVLFGWWPLLGFWITLPGCTRHLPLSFLFCYILQKICKINLIFFNCIVLHWKAHEFESQGTHRKTYKNVECTLLTLERKTHLCPFLVKLKVEYKFCEYQSHSLKLCIVQRGQNTNLFRVGCVHSHSQA